MKATIPGDPFAQPRPRATTIDGRPSLYDPASAKEWKGAAQYALRQHTNGDEILYPEGPLQLNVWAFHRCPKSDHRVRTPAPRRWRGKGKDVDNVAKAVMDAATGILWSNDSQVAVLRVFDVTAAQGEQPRVELEVTQLPEEYPRTQREEA